VQKGVRHGCIISPYLFNIYTKNIKRNVRKSGNYDSSDALKVGGIEIPELRYADDTVHLSQSEKNRNTRAQIC
jgi:hypothetical protein